MPGREQQQKSSAARVFIESVLGKFSSHPDMLKLQRNILFVLGLLPVVATVALVVYAYMHGIVSIAKWSNWVLSFKILLIGAGVTVGFIMTAVAMNLAGRTIANPKLGHVSDKDAGVPPLGILAGVAFFWLIPWAYRYLPYWSQNKEVELILNLICLAPFVCMLLWMRFATPEDVETKEESDDQNAEKVVRRPLFLVISLLLFASAVFFLLPQARVKTDIMRVVLILCTLTGGVAMLCVWLVNYKIVKTKKQKEEGKEDEKDEPPEFAKYIIANLPEGVKVQQETILCDGKETKADFIKTNIGPLVGDISPIAKDDTFLNRCLMGGKCPTSDQYVFLERFDCAYKEIQKKFLENEDPQASMLKADIIIHGPEGSGRTEALLAAAMDAAIVRGERVLYFVSENNYAQQLAQKINSRLEGLLVNCYYSADVLDKSKVDSWIADNSEDVLPNIVFATPEAIEKTLFGHERINETVKCNRIRNILLSFKVILVDDFLDMKLIERAHLTFILKKMRLLMASEYLLCQFVIASSPLSDIGIAKMGERLFGLEEFSRLKNVFKLRPRECEPFWYCSLKVHKDYSLDKASRELAKIAIRANCNTLLYNKGISASKAQEMEKEIQEDVTSGITSNNTNAQKIETISTQKRDNQRCGNVMVKHRLYELEQINLPIDTIFYLSLTCGNATAALRLNVLDGERAVPVFFRISDENEEKSEALDSFALLPDETALALRAWHLRSILPFIQPLSPVEENVWSHFGIIVSKNLPERDSTTRLSSEVAIQWHYDTITAYLEESNGTQAKDNEHNQGQDETVDSDHSDDIQSRYSKESIWPYLVLDEVPTIGGQGHDVNFSKLPSAYECIWLKRCPESPRGDELTLAKIADDGEKPERHIAVWKRGNGRFIGTTDLAQANDLILSIPSNSEEEYVPDFLSAPDRSEEGLYAISIAAKYRSGTELDYTIPIRKLTWTIPDLGLKVLFTSEAKGIAAFRLERKNRQGFRISGSISGMVNALGTPSLDRPRGYDYNAYASCIVLMPTLEYDDDPVENEDNGRTEQQISACMNGKWRTDATFGFSPALTHALTGALRKRINGWNFFTAAPAFYTKGRQDSVGEIVVWLLEPFTSGRTTFDPLRELLRDIDFRNELLKDAIDELTQLDLTGLRRASGMAFSNESITDADKNQALEALKRLMRYDPEAEAIERKKRKRRKEPGPRKDPSTYTPDEKEFEQIVLEALQNFQEYIDITDFMNAKKWTHEQIWEVLNDVLWNNPQIFYVSKYGIRSQYWGSPEEGYTRFLILDIPYGVEKDHFDICQARLNEAVERALAGLSPDDSDVIKALKLHDYIVKVCDYDTDAADRDDGTTLARTAYSVLVRHLAVCEGYTMAYRYLLEKVGIKCEEIISNKMRHCWNYVFINNSWYHVDTTWDDPVYSLPRRYHDTISREFFMMSDDKALRKEHHSWKRRGLPPATNHDYDNFQWPSVT